LSNYLADLVLESELERSIQGTWTNCTINQLTAKIGDIISITNSILIQLILHKESIRIVHGQAPEATISHRWLPNTVKNHD
jgi:hypothetical protein